jgi:hypothetical protein
VRSNCRNACRVCGKPARRSFCSAACRQKNHRDQQKLAAPIPRVIPISRLNREVAERKAAEGAGYPLTPPPKTTTSDADALLVAFIVRSDHKYPSEYR